MKVKGYEKIKNSWKKFNFKNLWLTKLTESTEVWKRANVEDLKELKSQITDFTRQILVEKVKI